jgi:6-phosphogluconate dehydrogenase
LGLLKIASDEFKYILKLGEIAKIWRAGCIIRADLLGDIMSAYQRDPALANLLMDETFRIAVEQRVSRFWHSAPLWLTSTPTAVSACPPT